MKKRYKQPACLNCHRPLSDHDNFCPACGQENTQLKLGISTLFQDFISNYFSFDSKLSRSSIPFIVKPGFLTNRYNEGKRTGYIHPLRLYLIISFLFSFSLAYYVDHAIAENKLYLSSLYKKKKKDTNGTLAAQIKAPPAADIPALADSLHATTPLAKPGVTKPAANTPDADEKAWVIDDNDPDNILFDIAQLNDHSLSDEEILRKMNWQDEGPHYKLFVHQYRKILQKDIDVFLPFVIKNLSIMMFLMLPVFAFFLYVLFGRKEKYFICHAIHALHLHSFSFMLITILILLEIFTATVSKYPELYLYAFIMITLYAFFSVKRVYKQSWLRTLLKFNVLGFFYFMSLSISVVLELFVSFMLF